MLESDVPDSPESPCREERHSRMFNMPGHTVGSTPKALNAEYQALSLYSKLLSKNDILGSGLNRNNSNRNNNNKNRCDEKEQTREMQGSYKRWGYLSKRRKTCEIEPTPTRHSNYTILGIFFQRKQMGPLFLYWLKFHGQSLYETHQRKIIMTPSKATVRGTKQMT